MLVYHTHVIAFLMLISIAGCGDTAKSASSNGNKPEVRKPESKPDIPRESALLKQEMMTITVELMRRKKTAMASDELRRQAAKILDAENVKIRKHYPEFLIVSAKTEEKLRAGTPIPDAAKRISESEKALIDFESPIPDLFKVMLRQHKAGTLSPLRTELLAQCMVGMVKGLIADLK